MVRLNRIYTRTGDDGTTGLVSGERRTKDDARVEAFGAVDEANAAVGVARLHSSDDALSRALSRIQNDFFDLGADLATPDTEEPPKHEPLRIAAAQVAWIEGEIDRLNETLEPLRSFVLPAGTALAAQLHVARTAARRAERAMVTLAKAEAVNPEALRYINRVSDFLFVAARHANDGGRADVLWVPGKNR